MKVGMVGLLTAMIGGYLTYGTTTEQPDSFVVRVLDNSQCSAPSYVVEMESETVHFSGVQVDTQSYPGAAIAEEYIWAAPAAEDGLISYRLHASYSDCPSITSELRIVENGWLLYENISGGELTLIAQAGH